MLSVPRNAGLLSIVASLTVGFALYWSYKKKKWILNKKEFVQVGEVAYMLLYPIKSCRGIKFTEARCTKLGLQAGSLRDRVFLLVNEDGVFVTARQEHALLLVVPSLQGENILAIDAPEMPTLTLDLNTLKDEKQMGEANIRRCKVWGQPVDGWDCGEEAAKWFQKYLGKENYRLVHHNERIRPKFAKEREKYKDLFVASDAAAFADLTPYMLMTESSVQDVNSRIEKTVGMRNFRPNIVLRNTEPYAEDNWLNVKIGTEATFRHTKPCQRCSLTTIDAETAIKNSEEPLKTLKTYRQTKDPFFKKYVGESALLGIGLCVDQEGNIETGDLVYATTR